MLVSKSDAQAVVETYIKNDGAFGKEETNITALKNTLSTQSQSSITKLEGKGYDAVRTVMIPSYDKLLDARKTCSDEIQTSISNISSQWVDFLESYPAMDVCNDKELPNLESTAESILRDISDLNTKLTDTTLSQSQREFIDSEIISKNESLEYTRKIIRKIEKMKTLDSQLSSKLSDEIVTSISKYKGMVDELSSSFLGFGASASAQGSNFRYDGKPGSPDPGSLVDAATPFMGTIGTSIADENREDKGNNDKIAQTALSYVNSTAEDLNANENSYFYNTDNKYDDSVDWNAKFLSDILLSNEDSNTLMKDYYEDEENYPDPINNTDSLLKYAMTDGTNMEFNWSEKSGELIKQKDENAIVDEYIPQEGDIVFFNNADLETRFDGTLLADQLPKAGRVGMIESIETITTESGEEKIMLNIVEGYATKDGSVKKIVANIEYSAFDDRILGFGTLKLPEDNASTTNENGIESTGIIEGENTSIDSAEENTPISIDIVNIEGGNTNE